MDLQRLGIADQSEFQILDMRLQSVAALLDELWIMVGINVFTPAVLLFDFCLITQCLAANCVKAFVSSEESRQFLKQITGLR